jgi:hypothetical protein
MSDTPFSPEKMPRHGLSNRYKNRPKAQQAADVLNEICADSPYLYSVIEFDAASWVVLRDHAFRSGEKPVAHGSIRQKTPMSNPGTDSKAIQS